MGSVAGMIGTKIQANICFSKRQAVFSVNFSSLSLIGAFQGNFPSLDTPTEKPILAGLFDRLPTNHLISGRQSHLTTWIIADIRLMATNG